MIFSLLSTENGIRKPRVHINSSFNAKSSIANSRAVHLSFYGKCINVLKAKLEPVLKNFLSSNSDDNDDIDQPLLIQHSFKLNLMSLA